MVIGQRYFYLCLILPSLPDPDVLAMEIVENLEAGLEAFREVRNGLTIQL